MQEYIRTISGLHVNVFDPTEDMICIEDIAHGLSHQCRFGGHTEKFYSVAQHSVLCSNLSIFEYKLASLLHDASEAYLLDVPSPIKNKLTNYKEIEDKLMKVISKKFNFQWPLHKEVKLSDELMLKIEWYELILKERNFYNIKYISCAKAKNNFLKAFYRLNS